MSKLPQRPADSEHEWLKETITDDGTKATLAYNGKERGRRLALSTDRAAIEIFRNISCYGRE